MALLAAGSDPEVQLQVISHHGDFFQNLWPAADQGGSFQGFANLAVLDPVGLGTGKDEFAVGDVDLAAAETGGIDAILDAF